MPRKNRTKAIPASSTAEPPPASSNAEDTVLEESMESEPGKSLPVKTKKASKKRSKTVEKEKVLKPKVADAAPMAQDESLATNVDVVAGDVEVVPKSKKKSKSSEKKAKAVESVPMEVDDDVAASVDEDIGDGNAFVAASPTVEKPKPKPKPVAKPKPAVELEDAAARAAAVIANVLKTPIVIPTPTPESEKPKKPKQVKEPVQKKQKKAAKDTPPKSMTKSVMKHERDGAEKPKKKVRVEESSSPNSTALTVVPQQLLQPVSQQSLIPPAPSPSAQSQAIHDLMGTAATQLRIMMYNMAMVKEIHTNSPMLLPFPSIESLSHTLSSIPPPLAASPTTITKASLEIIEPVGVKKPQGEEDAFRMIVFTPTSPKVVEWPFLSLFVGLGSNEMHMTRDLPPPASENEKVLLIRGAQGIGKTRTCLEYASKNPSIYFHFSSPFECQDTDMFLNKIAEDPAHTAFYTACLLISRKIVLSRCGEEISPREMLFAQCFPQVYFGRDPFADSYFKIIHLSLKSIRGLEKKADKILEKKGKLSIICDDFDTVSNLSNSSPLCSAVPYLVPQVLMKEKASFDTLSRMIFVSEKVSSIEIFDPVHDAPHSPRNVLMGRAVVVHYCCSRLKSVEQVRKFMTRILEFADSEYRIRYQKQLGIFEEQQKKKLMKSKAKQQLQQGAAGGKSQSEVIPKKKKATVKIEKKKTVTSPPTSDDEDELSSSGSDSDSDSDSDSSSSSDDSDSTPNSSNPASDSEDAQKTHEEDLNSTAISSSSSSSSMSLISSFIDFFLASSSFAMIGRPGFAAAVIDRFMDKYFVPAPAPEGHPNLIELLFSPQTLLFGTEFAASLPALTMTTFESELRSRISIPSESIQEILTLRIAATLTYPNSRSSLPLDDASPSLAEAWSSNGIGIVTECCGTQPTSIELNEPIAAASLLRLVDNSLFVEAICELVTDPDNKKKPLSRSVFGILLGIFFWKTWMQRELSSSSSVALSSKSRFPRIIFTDLISAFGSNFPTELGRPVLLIPPVEDGVHAAIYEPGSNSMHFICGNHWMEPFGYSFANVKSPALRDGISKWQSNRKARFDSIATSLELTISKNLMCYKRPSKESPEMKKCLSEDVAILSRKNAILFKELLPDDLSLHDLLSLGEHWFL